MCLPISTKECSAVCVSKMYDNGATTRTGNSNDTRMLESTKNVLGIDKKGNQRSLFLYDGE